MKKFILSVSLILGLSMAIYGENYYGEPTPTKEIVNDSTILFYNVDRIELKQSEQSTTYIIDMDTNKLVAKVQGNDVIELGHKGTYKVMSRTPFTKVDVKTQVDRMYY